MSDQPLIPFKAIFVLSVETTMKDFFQDSENVSLLKKYKPVLLDEDGYVDVAKFIEHYRFGSKVYNDYKKFDFKFHQPFDISDTNLLSDDDYNYVLKFKLNSFNIQVLQITNNGNQITFSDSANEVKTINLENNLALFKV